MDGLVAGGVVGLVAAVVVGLEGYAGEGEVVGLAGGLVGAPAGVTVSFSVFDAIEYAKLPLGSLNSAPMS